MHRTIVVVVIVVVISAIIVISVVIVVVGDCVADDDDVYFAMVFPVKKILKQIWFYFKICMACRFVNTAKQYLDM